MKRTRFTETQIVSILKEADAKEKLDTWRIDYNESRPHKALDHRTPSEYAAEVANEGRKF